MRIISLFGFLAITLSLAGCAKDDAADDANPNTPTGIEIEGTWTSDFGEEVIADDSWSSGDTVAIVADYSNADNVAVTQNPDDAEFSPGKYNRIVWTDVAGDSFFYCITDFGLDSEEDAKSASTMPDDSEPEVGGCGGSFPWTKLTRK
jgi:hypothetical protein